MIRAYTAVLKLGSFEKVTDDDSKEFKEVKSCSEDGSCVDGSRIRKCHR